MSLVSEARAKRNSSSVVLMKILNTRDFQPDAPIAVIEGKDDVGVWSVWIRRVSESLDVEPIPAGGKSHVLEARDRVMRNRSLDTEGIIFIVDKDYDDNSDLSSQGDIYCTDRYSIENYFISSRVINGVLNNYFGCSGDLTQKEVVIGKFFEFLDLYRDVTERIHFCCYLVRRNRIQGTSFPTKFSEIANTSEGLALQELAESKLFAHEECIPAEKADECLQEFKLLNFRDDWRGKFHLLALRFFLQSLQGERDGVDERVIFSKSKPISDFKYSELKLAEFAAVTELPDGLAEFLERNFGSKAA